MPRPTRSPPPKPEAQHPRRDPVAIAIEHVGQQIVHELHLIHKAISKCHSPTPSGPTLGAFVSAVYGRTSNMPVTVPVPKLLDTEKIVLSVMPRLANGHVDIAAVISWTSSDPSQIGVEPGTDPFVFTDPQFGEDVTCPGAFNCTATTPLQSGSATVTASAPGYDSADYGPIVYEPGQPRSLNASVGSPISDL